MRKSGGEALRVRSTGSAQSATGRARTDRPSSGGAGAIDRAARAAAVSKRMVVASPAVLPLEEERSALSPDREPSRGPVRRASLVEELNGSAVAVHDRPVRMVGSLGSPGAEKISVSASGGGRSPSADKAPAPPEADIHFGTVLRRAREQKGMTLQALAAQTRISSRWLSALEDAQLDGLPAPVFLSGYLRAMARAVGLDGADILESYYTLLRRKTGGAMALPAHERMLGTGTDPTLHRLIGHRWAPYVAVLVVVLGLVVLGLALWRHGVFGGW